MQRKKRAWRQRLTCAAVSVFCSWGFMAPVMAAKTGIANEPLFEGEKSETPNLMLLMDTSDSMSWTHMPDQLEIKEAKQYRAYKSSACNSIYYNPATTYEIPVDAKGNRLPTPSFNAAFYDYYIQGTSRTIDLGKKFQAHNEDTRQSGFAAADVEQKAYYYNYINGTVPKEHFNAICLNSKNQPDVGYDTDVHFQKVEVGAQEKQNFAIWYSYYRTRMAMVKSSISLAFAPVGEKYRVGFIAVNPYWDNAGGTAQHTTVHADRYQKIEKFDATQRNAWYEKLHAQTSKGFSPAREGLARVGRHYAGKTDGINQGMPDDPVQSSCQRNYAILTTDGYWNTKEERKGPVQLDGTTRVGQQDGKPLYDKPTDKTGLAPWGVYDLDIRYVEYGRKKTKIVKYQAVSCTVPLKVRRTKKKLKTTSVYKKFSQFSPGTNTKLREKKVVERLATDWIPSMTLVRHEQTTTTYQKITRQYLKRKGEGTEAVVSCVVGVDGCEVDETTEATTKACVSQTANKDNNWKNVECRSVPSNPVGVASCTAFTGPSKDVSCTSEDGGEIQVPGYRCSQYSNGYNYGWITHNGKRWYGTCKVSNIKTKKVDACDQDTSTPGNARSCSNGVELQGWTPVSSCVVNYSEGVYCRDRWVCQGDATNNGSCVPGDRQLVGTGGECKAQEPNATNNWVRISCDTKNEIVNEVVDPNDPDCSKGSNPSAATDWKGYKCTDHIDPGYVVDANCAEEPASAANGWVHTYCVADGTATVAGNKLQSYEEHQNWEQRISDDDFRKIGNSWTTNKKDIGDCLVLPDEVFVPDDGNREDYGEQKMYGYSGPGSFNSLADVAQYYYATDLRAWMNNPVKWKNDLKPTGSEWYDDRANWQHMVTYVIGLGVSGTIDYIENYLDVPDSDDGSNLAKSDFAKIRRGDKSWPIWPNYSAKDSNQDTYHVNESIDDFWHAAVNGRGRYYSTKNAGELKEKIVGILEKIGVLTATGAGMSMDNPVGVTEMYRTEFSTKIWTGDVEAISPERGYPLWTAQGSLQNKVDEDTDTRSIWFMSAAGTLQEFRAAHLPAAQKAQLQAGLDALSQREKKDSAQLALMTLETLVDYLRGQKQHETTLYRYREAVLGDIINSKALYVQGAMASYRDTGYRAFKAAQTGRKGMVYVGANDGMLHAFDASSGEELWAYVPLEVMGQMYWLADDEYPGSHHYFVDGSPVVADVYDDTALEWKTILVGGFNAGGNGYYALDITNPDHPKSLWETHQSCSTCDFGLSFGQAVIGKNKAGKWTVFLASGYNNSTGEGKLFALDAITGNLLETYNTGRGTSTDPAGLAYISGYAKNYMLNNTVERLYGGDLLGNIWRFDIDGKIDDAAKVQLLGVAKTDAGVPQPITTPPALAYAGKKDYVVVGTGKLLDSADVPSEMIHTVYTVVDSLESPAKIGKTAVYQNLRSDLVRYHMNADDTLTCVAPTNECAKKATDEPHPKGWFVDFPSRKKVKDGALLSGEEHVNVEIKISPNNNVIVSTSHPKLGSCSDSAVGRVHSFPIKAGNLKSDTETTKLGDEAYIVSTDLFLTPDEPGLWRGSCDVGTVCKLITLSDGTPQFAEDKAMNPVPDSRMSWRELTAPMAVPGTP